MENKFNINDIVICIQENTISECHLGKLYTVINIVNVWLFFDIQIHYRQYYKRFIKYSDRNKPENKKIMIELVKKRLIGNI